MKRGKSIIFVIGVVTASVSYAQDASQNSDNIKQILLNTKLQELDVKVDQDANSQADPNSVQYKIGFKDGYKKAVADLKNSLGQSTLVIPGQSGAKAASAATNITPKQQPNAKMVDLTESGNSDELVSKSFNELMRNGNWDAAIVAASKAISMKPNDHAAYINRSWGYAEKGELDKAIQDANKAVELSPRNPMAHNNRAYAYELAGSLTKAKQDYQIACELNYQPACETVSKFNRAAKGETVAEVNELLNRSFAKFKEKDWNAVEEFTTRAINLDPANAMAYVNRAAARSELGRLSPALDDCNRAIQLNPGLGLAHNNCGYAYELMGEHKQAKIAYEQACNLGVKESCRDFYRLANPAR